MNLGKAAKLALAATAIGAATPEDADAMYVGPKAKGWDKLKNKFSSLYDKMTKAEISDKNARILSEKARPSAGRSTHSWYGQGTKLGEILEHPELYEQYPFLKDIETLAMVGKDYPTSGHFVASHSQLGGKPYIQMDASSKKNLKGGLLHEIQHAIQEQEGWAKGGSPNRMELTYNNLQQEESLLKQTPNYIKAKKVNDKTWDRLFVKQDLSIEDALKVDERLRRKYPEWQRVRNIDDELFKMTEGSNAYDSSGIGNNAYRKLSGEIEARDTTSRMGLSQAQRASKLPYSSENINPKDAIVKFGVGGLAAGTTLSQAKDALAAKYKKMESDQALQDAYSPVDMVIAGATGGATMGLRAISALADPVINYAIDRMLGD